MSIWGKIIGGVAGFAVGGPLGALLGAGAGHAMDKTRDGSWDPLGKLSALGEQAKQMVFTAAVVTLAAKMAKADGLVTPDEVEALRRVFNIPPGDMGLVGDLFEAARRDSTGPELYARQIARLFKDNPAMLEEILNALLLVGQADGPLNAAELDFLDQVADIFGLSERDFDRLRAGLSGSGDPYLVLGITRASSDAEIKLAWRRLIRENHPDALIAQGLPQDFIDLATRKMAAINAAYDQIRKERGLG